MDIVKDNLSKTKVKKKIKSHQGQNRRQFVLDTKSNVTTLDQIPDKKYGKKGLPKREEWEQQFESFRLGVLLEEARLKLGMTQKELAQKC